METANFDDQDYLGRDGMTIEEHQGSSGTLLKNSSQATMQREPKRAM